MATVSEQHAGAAGQRHHTDTVATWKLLGAEGLAVVDEIINVLHFDKTAFTECGAEQFITGGQSRSMRSGGLAADFGVADFPDQDRFAEFQCTGADAAQASAFGGAFKECGEDFDIGPFNQVFHPVERGQVGFVAGGNDMVEAEPVVAADGHHAEAKAAGLRDHGDRAGLECLQLKRAAEAESEIGIEVEHAKAVRANDANATGFDCGEQLVIEFLAGFAGFTETCRQNDREGDAGFSALFDGPRHQSTRQGNQCDVAGFGYRGDIRITLQSLDLGVFGIDRINLSLKAIFGQQLDRLAADACEVGGGANDSDTAWIEKAREVWDGTGLD